MTGPYKNGTLLGKSKKADDHAAENSKFRVFWPFSKNNFSVPGNLHDKTFYWYQNLPFETCFGGVAWRKIYFGFSALGLQNWENE